MADALRGRTALVTGSNTGIGRVAAERLAELGAHVLLANRSVERTQPVVDAIRSRGGSAEHLPLDLSDLAQVREAARAVRARGSPLHLLLANAAAVGVRALTAQGFEPTFGVTHLGHYLLVRLLVPELLGGAPSRVVVTASRAHERRGARAPDWQRLRRLAPRIDFWRPYQTAKLCNVLFTRELARRLEPARTCAYAVHPGVIATDIWRRIPWPVRPLMTRGMRTPEQGAVSMLRCATDPALAGQSGGYYGDEGEPRTPSALAQDDALALALWDQSEEWTAPWLEGAPPLPRLP